MGDGRPKKARCAADTVTKQEGVTDAERYLARLCERSFLSLWSYPSVYRDQGKTGGRQGKEVCDLLVVFGDDIIVFSDKDCAFPASGNLARDWSRWFRRAVQHSAEQVWGAERWIRTHPGRLFLDRACTRRFPVLIPDLSRARFHRIVVAHAAAGRCRELLGGSGSLILHPPVHGKAHYEGTIQPFMVGDLDPAKGFVHVLDDTSLEVVMGTLDTTADFVAYLAKKEAFVRSGRLFCAAGEDDLLAYYLQEVNEQGEHDFAFPPEAQGRHIVIPDGEWRNFVVTEEWSARQRVNKVSYVWDHIIERFSRHILAGTSAVGPNVSLHQQEIAVRMLARENRVSRRVLATALGDFLAKPSSTGLRVRVVGPLSAGSPYYVFLTLAPDNSLDRNQYRLVRRSVMNAYCQTLKLTFPEARDVVAIATEPTGWAGPTSEDVLYCDISELTPEQEAEAREIQAEYGFLTRLGKPFRASVYEYPLKRASTD